MNASPLVEESAPPTAVEPVVAPVESLRSGERLSLPEHTQPVQIFWTYLNAIILIHLFSLLALHPYFFSWSAIIFGAISCPVYGVLGITLCYHRLLTHQGLTLPKWFEHICAILGVCTLQDSPARWVAIHRMHHKHADERPDPHTPLVSFLWAHMGWLVVVHREHSAVRFYEQYAKDVLRDPFYLRLENQFLWFWIYVIHAALYFLAGLAIGWLWDGTAAAGVQFGASLLVWAVFVRTVAIWHGTWAVNSVTHVCGYRNYDTADDSRNEFVTAFFAYGEGWHNNHHADQRAAAHGHKWWEFDLTYQVIRVLEFVGLAKDVVRPRAWTEKNRS